MPEDLRGRMTRQRLRANLTLDQLFAFQTVVRAGSMRAAAKDLALSQPAVSQRIRHLEHITGTRLFDRHQGAQVTLTREGRLLLALAKDLLDRVDSFHDDLQNLQRGSRGVLRVVSSSDYMVYVAMQGVLALKAAGQHIEINLNHAASLAEIEDTLNEEAAELGICRAPVADGLHQLALLHEELVLVAPAGHSLVTAPEADRPSLLGEHLFATFSEGMRTREHIERWADKEGLQLNVAIEARSFEPLRQAVMNNLAVAVLPTYAVTRQLADGVVEIVPLPGLPLERDAVVVGKKGHQLSREARLFLNALEHAVTGLGPGGVTPRVA